ncbi:helix-turn-helix domain-containing protein [Streptomyces sp. MUM 178J]|uniref:helix-turn-helix domain-containing protein n=1 Tax=Streptomyces sp. MUM 178J TaxID=2791991 RepID=UPI001F03BF45|nr:helix-turn-helix domain-containing protein [Streptomyces sp. MUM 178J]WRQ81814.1 peptidoglycan-binding protein [Streptomyces sp. MUM 178J]
MARWKELPAALDDHERQLVVQLRRLKDHSGLSLAALAGKTSYSRSSWERYLNGKKPVPRGAVEELARICGTEPTRLLVLHEVAEQAKASRAVRPAGGGLPATEPPSDSFPGAARPSGAASGAASGTSSGSPSATVSGPGSPLDATGDFGVSEVGAENGTAELQESGLPPSGEGPEPRVRRTVPLAAALAAAAAVLAALAFAGGFLTASAGEDGTSAGKGGNSQQELFVYRQGETYECEPGEKDGKLYAGHSLVQDTILALNGSGWDVVEAQCLLKRHGFDPGDVDGLYGPSTETAAKRFQAARELVQDGIVGPDTLGELRRAR